MAEWEGPQKREGGPQKWEPKIPRTRRKENVEIQAETGRNPLQILVNEEKPLDQWSELLLTSSSGYCAVPENKSPNSATTEVTGGEDSDFPASLGYLMVRSFLNGDHLEASGLSGPFGHLCQWAHGPSVLDTVISAPFK